MENESYICVNDNIVYFRKGLGIWRGKIIDFFSYKGLKVKCLFNNGVELSFPASSLIKTPTFWFVGLTSSK